MNHYIPNDKNDQKKMLDEIGVSSIDALFSDIPEMVRYKKPIEDNALSEYTLKQKLKTLADKNTSGYPCFLGGGFYDYYIPSTVSHITSISEFNTAYTPYQPEISQGTLTAIFEFQTAVCELSGMDVANASMYDGASALAEAVLMAARITKKKKALLSKTINPQHIDVVKTYVGGKVELAYIDEADFLTDIDNIDLTDDLACIVLQTPNFYGAIEDMDKIKNLSGKIADKKTLLIVSANPMSLSVLKPPSSYGADIYVGEGQPLGGALSYGGAALGLMAAKQKYVRQLPSRIAGKTNDKDGKTGYVLTLQTREQHIKREKATSNICSNQALNALGAIVYLTTLGEKGLNQAAVSSLNKAHYLADRLSKLNGISVMDAEFFNEFTVDLPIDPDDINKALLDKGIIGGFNLSKLVDTDKNRYLLALSDKTQKADMDELISVIEKAVK